MKTKLLISMLGSLLLLSTATAEWPIEGIEPFGKVEGMITIPDTSGGVWFIYDSVDPPPTVGDKAPISSKVRRSIQVTQGYLRIQHIDSSGTKLLGEWGESVIQDTSYTHAWLHGAVPTSDGGVFVAYMTVTPYTDPYGYPYYGLYGQRFNASGDPMWRTFGVPLTVQDGRDFVSSTNLNVYDGSCSDGADGTWLLVYEGFTMKKYVTHVDSSGVVNPTYIPPYLVGAGANIRSDNGIAICEDAKGGAHIGYIDDSNGDFYHQRVSQSWPGGRRRAIYNPNNFHGVTATPDGYGGVYFMVSNDGTNADIRRVNSENQVSTNRALIGGNSVCRWPAILENGDAVMMFTSYYLGNDTLRYARFDTTLNYGVHPDTASILEGVHTSTHNSPAVIAALNGEDIIGSIRRIEDIDDGVSVFISMHRIPPAGKPDLWATPPRVLIESKDPENWYYYFQRLTRLSDGSILVQYLYEHGYWRFHRISEAGPPITDTTENPPPASLPDRFNIESAWPNPFNGTVTIRVSLPTSNPAQLMIHNLTGQVVATLPVPEVETGLSSVIWTPDTALASGVYFAQVSQSGQTTRPRKIVLMR
jgi:hypothetical protein